MAEFITKSQLINTSKRDEKESVVKISSLIDKFTMSIKGRDTFEVSIFLSHSHKDKDLVYFLFSIFKRLNVKVYVDWLDDDLSYPPTGETAIKIKRKIKENKKFIFLATNEAITSKWCNWELGLGDENRYIDDIALFPVADNSGIWRGNEYLQIYPYLDKTYKSLKYDNGFTIIYPNGKKVDFEKWLRS
jgi:hypothetical protein